MCEINQNQLLSLVNPISSMVGKDREHFTRDDLINVIETVT